MKDSVLIRKTRVPTYRSRLWIVVSPSIIRAIDVVEDQIDTKVHGDKDKLSTSAYTYASIDEKGRKTFILFLRPGSKPGEVAHECLHVLNLVFLWHGVKLSLTNDEPQTYLMEDIVNKAHNAIKYYKRQRK